MEFILGSGVICTLGGIMTAIAVVVGDTSMAGGKGKLIGVFADMRIIAL